MQVSDDDDDDYEYTDEQLSLLRRIQEIVDNPTIEGAHELETMTKRSDIVTVKACAAILDLLYGPPEEYDPNVD